MPADIFLLVGQQLEGRKLLSQDTSNMPGVQITPVFPHRGMGH